MQDKSPIKSDNMTVEVVCSSAYSLNLAGNIALSAERIAASWRKSTSAIIETGQLLNEAERDFTDEDYQLLREYLVTEVGLSTSVISKLKTIARNPILLDPHYQVRLPPSYATLYQISKMERDTLIEAIEDGDITPNTQLKDVTAKFGSLVANPRKKSTATVLSISISGNIADIDPNTLENFRTILNELKKQVTVNVKGI